MSATAWLLADLCPEVLAVPDDGTGGWRLVLLVGPELPGPEEAELAAGELAARLTQALAEDLAPVLRVPSERLALPL